MTPSSDTYDYEIFCGNCDHHTTHTIPRGKRIVAYMNETECENCGCLLSGQKDDRPPRYR